MVEEDRVGLAGVRAPENDDVGVLSLEVRGSPSPGSEHRRQTGDARGVSSPVAAVDVVRVHDGACELLGHVVHLVCRLLLAKKNEALVTLLAPGGEARLRTGSRLFP